MADRRKSVLITGCSSGIGNYCARHLSRSEWRVIASARKPDDIEQLRKEGFETVCIDMDDPKSVTSGLNDALSRTDGRLDALFNNAGYGMTGAVEDVPREALREQFETNVFGLHQLTCEAVKVMRAQGGGRIVHNSSVLGFACLPYRGAYNASKHALEALAATMRLELRDTDIHVSVIQPGPITSRFRDNAILHYRRHIDAAASAHHERYMAMEDAWASGVTVSRFTMGPEAVLAALEHALESPAPRLFYRVTLPTKLFWWLRRLLPTYVLDSILWRSG